ncbi:MAG: prephenate dehydrogenase/arogenate dehydrogenase family protein [Candidatus Omnitrophica bacterium]|nr:prephenate dehydrogenase/arogenate dehydrogenase family protein [Candidatus Omnitrophota bacterium]
MALFHRVTIVGLGLMGGSLGLAVKRRRVAREVIGLSRNASTLRLAKMRRAIDWGTMDARRAVSGSELVIIATPVSTITAQAKRLAPFMSRGSVLSDVGSTKAHIVRQLERALPSRIAFVGAHPIAGSEQQGVGAADARLFDGSLCIVTPTARTDQRGVRRVVAFWSALVDGVITMPPARHDRVLAQMSHLPHLLAYCLSLAAEETALLCTPRSFLDATRVAKSDPDVWDDIFLTNRAPILAAMGRFERHWRALRTLIERPKRSALRRLLARAKSNRDALEDR